MLLILNSRSQKINFSFHPIKYLIINSLASQWQFSENFFSFFFSLKLQQSPANVYLSHEVFEKSNAWAVIPILIDILNQLIKPQTKWFVLCEANSVVNLGKLLLSLREEDEMKVFGIIRNWLKNARFCFVRKNSETWKEKRKIERDFLFLSLIRVAI